jgi:hypothetical protein
MPATEHPFATLASVPVHFAREPIAPYGSRGKPWSFACTHAFHATLERAFTELWELCPLGKAEVIASAGAHVPKDGFHGQGEAFDLDALFWSARDFVTRRFPTDAAFYLAVEAVLRRHFGTVLAHSYNAAHEDHFHVQAGRPVGFSRSSKSDTLFIQNVSTRLLGDPVDIDGRWGTETAGALERAQATLNVTGSLEDVARYRVFLEAVAHRGFSAAPGVAAEPTDTPLRRLNSLYRIIESELGQTAARKRIEAAVTAFTAHPDVKRVVGGG